MPTRPLLRLAAGIMAAGLALLAPTTEANAVPRAPDRHVGILSFNIHHGQGPDGVLDLERVARTIEGSGAGIVGLQEVDRHWGERSDFVDQAGWLARRLRMHVVYGANLDLEQRGVLEARINVRGVRVLVFNTHLQHNSQAEWLLQVEALREVIGTPQDSVVLLGDLNATPETPEIAALTGALRDAWVEAGVGDGYTVSSTDPYARIDYVLTSDDVVTRSAAVVTSDASDHLPLSVDLVLPGHRVGRSGDGRK